MSEAAVSTSVIGVCRGFFRVGWEYATAIFISACLLFAVQPIVARSILPEFGGSAVVWSTCMVFFQCVLLLGYLYAHWSVQTRSPRTQVFLHVALLAISAAVVRLPSSTSGVRPDQNPAYQIFVLLAGSVGLPYFLLSATTPLLQAWYGRVHQSVLPYRLFALSNLGSLLTLVLYPVAAEPFFETGSQFAAWSGAFRAFAIICGWVAFRSRRFIGETSPRSPRLREREKAEPRRTFAWTVLPACSSALLLAVTNSLCQDVAAIPLLWILPLSVYLLTFIFCFDHDRWYSARVFRILLPLALTSLLYVRVEAGLPLQIIVLIHVAALFIACMFCHGQLAALKPQTQHLTSYYLSIALGGAVGGLFVGFAAPALFNTFLELDLALALCVALALRHLYGYSSRGFVVFCAVVAFVLPVLFGEMSVRAANRKTRLRVRNAYGALSVQETNDSEPTARLRMLLHGRICHGAQFLTTSKKAEPTMYFQRVSGCGLALMRKIPRHRVGLIGLGAGTLAAYGNPGDVYRFYEINPLVISLANSEFSFLKDSKAQIDVVLGDARISLEREPDQGFDTLVIDAFSGDAIPVHLLTREAFRCYLRHLKPGGIIAVHITNRYLDLSHLLDRVAREFGKEAWIFGAMTSTQWVLISDNQASLRSLASEKAASRIENTGIRLWTDQYSNLFSVLR